jgi:hypothetical protein
VVVTIAAEVIMVAAFISTIARFFPLSAAEPEAAFGAEPEGGASEPLSLEMGATFKAASEEGASTSLPLSTGVFLGASKFGVAWGWERRVAVTLK